MHLCKRKLAAALDFHASRRQDRRVPREGAAAPGAQAVKLQVTGMHCSACSSAVERALGALPGIRSAAVSLTMQQADVVRAPGGASEVRPSAGAAVKGAVKLEAVPRCCT